jgi:hypothetical protein
MATKTIAMPPELEQIGNLLASKDQQGAPGALEALANMLGLGSIRQALYDVLGAYPAANVLPYAYSFQLSTQVSQGPVLANQTSQASIKITADSAFIAKYITGA